MTFHCHDLQFLYFYKVHHSSLYLLKSCIFSFVSRSLKITTALSQRSLVVDFLHSPSHSLFGCLLRSIPSSDIYWAASAGQICCQDLGIEQGKKAKIQSLPMESLPMEKPMCSQYLVRSGQICQPKDSTTRGKGKLCFGKGIIWIFTRN